MRKLFFLLAVSSIASAEVPPPPAPADSIVNAIQEGKTKLSFRARHENVSDKSTKVSNGNVLTVQTRMNYQSKSYQDFSMGIELNNVSSFLNRRYNPQVPGLTKSQYAPIRDVKGAKLTLGFLQSNYFEESALRFGRQQLKLDNGRFIDSRTFRQTPQTFDGLTFYNTSVPKLELFMAYLTRVSKPWAVSFIEGKSNSRHHLLNANIDAIIGRLSGFFYLFKDNTFYLNSNRTYGTRLYGKKALMQDFTASYDLSLAMQKARDSRPRYTSLYHAMKVGLHIEYASMHLGYENLGGNKFEPNKSFIMPYGNVHGFLGWADIFEETPHQGLKDLYASINGKFLDFELHLAYHNFRNQEGFDRRIGKEIDFKIEKQFNDIFYAGLKYAKFSARKENLAYDDKKKVWFTIKLVFD